MRIRKLLCVLTALCCCVSLCAGAAYAFSFEGWLTGERPDTPVTGAEFFGETPDTFDEPADSQSEKPDQTFDFSDRLGDERPDADTFSVSDSGDKRTADSDVNAYLGKKYTAYQYEVSGYKADASMLGAEYAVTLLDDHSATLSLAGAEMAGMAWTETENGVSINYYGVANLDVTFMGDEIVMNYMDAMLLYMKP